MKISNSKLGIGIPTNFTMIPTEFFDSFILMEKPEWIYLRASTGHIEDMRNGIVKNAIQAGCSHLIMMDTDQVYDAQTIPRLLSHKLPIVGCLVYRRYPPFDPLMLRGEIGKYQNINEWEPGSLVEVDATGTGCVLYDVDVFKKMPSPWFKFSKSSGAVVGEDIGFCSDLREAGYKIFVDTSIPAGHLSRMIINEGTWKLYRKVKETEAMHKIEHGTLITKKEE